MSKESPHRPCLLPKIANVNRLRCENDDDDDGGDDDDDDDDDAAAAAAAKESTVFSVASSRTSINYVWKDCWGLEWWKFGDLLLSCSPQALQRKTHSASHVCVTNRFRRKAADLAALFPFIIEYLHD